jgi:hypothetical protein
LKRVLTVLVASMVSASVAHAAPRLLLLLGEDPMQQSLYTELALDPTSVETVTADTPVEFERWSAAEQSAFVREQVAASGSVAGAWLDPYSRTVFLWAPGQGRDLTISVAATSDQPGAELAQVARNHLAQMGWTQPVESQATVVSVAVPGAVHLAYPKWWVWGGVGAAGGGALRAGGRVGAGFGQRLQLRVELAGRSALADVGSEWEGTLGLWLRRPEPLISVSGGLGVQLRRRSVTLGAGGPEVQTVWLRPAVVPGARLECGRRWRVGAWTEASVGPRVRIWQDPQGVQVLTDPLVQWVAGAVVSLAVD